MLSPIFQHLHTFHLNSKTTHQSAIQSFHAFPQKAEMKQFFFKTKNISKDERFNFVLQFLPNISLLSSGFAKSSQIVHARS